jgi:hypothetical protein
MQVPEVINAVGEAKALHEERLMLIDRITKLSSENVNLSAELHKALQMKRKLERDFIRYQEGKTRATPATTGDSQSQSQSQSQTAVKTEGGGQSAGGAGDGESSMKAEGGAGGDSGGQAYAQKEKELTRKITILEKQLTQSEADKAKTEMDLTQRMAQPLTQQDTLVAHLKKAVDDLRQQCKQRVSAHQADSLALREKITNFEVGMRLLESNTAAKVTEITKQASTEVSALRAEKKELQSLVYVFCYTIVLPSFLVVMVSLSLLSIYYCLPAFSDTT